MDYIIGIQKKDTLTFTEVFMGEHEGEHVKLRGAVHTIRDMGEVSFLVLRRAEGLLQCVYEEDKTDFTLSSIHEGATLEAEGVLRSEERAPNGVELCLSHIEILSAPAKDSTYPIPISKWKLDTSLETKLSLRPISLRNIRERAVFKLQEGIVRAFRDYLFTQNFTEIHTPKIVSGNAEGGANVFKLEYFGKRAFLAQSPQTYKQMMVGVYDRVFEVAPVFRAEKHNTVRHLNEYTSMDLEMGYIDSFYDIMEVEQQILSYMCEFLKKEYAKELRILDVTLPDAKKIPYVRFDEAKRLVAEKYDRKIKNPYDLEPEEEQLIGRYFMEEYGSDFVFVTHYPSKKRPFYAMDDAKDTTFTLSFDLLFKGMEITTGGQRIHDYESLLAKMSDRGMSMEGFEDYLSIFKHGMPCHGGLGIGLERLTMGLIGEKNVRETTLFPRDVSRLTP